jgi:tryptophan-rich sensory protein
LITPNDAKWFKRLQRPRWLTFEPAIPFIWIVIFICAAGQLTLFGNATQVAQKLGG